MPTHFSNSDLESFLDESLPAERMAAIEDSLRQSNDLQKQLATINGRRDAGLHSLGEIWRRHRITCPSREQLGSYLLGVLPRDTADYIKFHLETIECRYCEANLADLTAQQSASSADVAQRRSRYFQSSVGRLSKQ